LDQPNTLLARSHDGAKNISGLKFERNRKKKRRAIAAIAKPVKAD
jgi:hypothetical protein